MNAVVHRFGPQLEYSARLSDEASWVEFYSRLWPDMVANTRLDADSEFQRHGIDRIVYLKNGKQFTIDEKKRDKDYGDILLEEWSVFYGEVSPLNKVGWALDHNKRCDFIAYAIVPSKKCYFLPFEILRQAFVVNRSEWARTYGVRDAQNVGYITRNIPVTWNTLYAAMVRQMLRQFGAGSLELPPAIANNHQMEFGWP